MDRISPPPPPPFPPFGHGGPAPGLVQLPNDFTRMNINPNPANSAKPVVSVPKFDGGFPINGRDRPPVTYEGFTFRKAEPEMFGQTKTWAKAYKVPMPVSHEALLEQVKKKQRKKSVLDQYSELDTLKQAQIDRLIEDKKREEKDPRFEWKLAALKTETKGYWATELRNNQHASHPCEEASRKRHINACQWCRKGSTGTDR